LHHLIDLNYRYSFYHIHIARSRQKSSLLLLDWQKEFEFGREFFFTVQAIGEVYPSDSTVRMDGDSQSFNVIASVGSACEIREIELDLVPSLVQPHGHGTYKWFDASCRLVVACPEASPNILVV
jgi:hypothetical protein